MVWKWVGTNKYLFYFRLYIYIKWYSYKRRTRIECGANSGDWFGCYE